MIKLEALIGASIALLVLSVILLILALVKKTRLLSMLTGLSFLALVGTGLYTLYHGFFLAVDTTIEVAQKLFPPFDSGIPDTEANKKNFRSFLKVELTPDVKNIYCFDDAIGQDADYMFAFNCDSATAERIIDQHVLRKDSLPGNNADGLQHDFPWWNKERIAELQSYFWNADTFYKLFWYDEAQQKAYYFEYDL